MLKSKILGRIIIIASLFVCTNVAAQTMQIDTIFVDMATDSIKKIKKELTPALDLSALRKASREDSVKKAQLALDKKALEEQKLKKIKAKRLQEKEEKAKKSKLLAEKRKIEKAEREKALAEKEALKKAEEKKRKEEKKLAKEKERQRKKEEKKRIAEQKAQKLLLEKQKRKKEADAAQAATKIPEVKIDDIKNLEIRQAAKAAVDPNRPNVIQKDNAYGTVRLAYDDLAASFLLTIPTETKMHFHKNHSEHIMLIEGEGMVLLGYKTIKLKKDELIFVTKGTPHKIINSGKRKLKVLSIQSPFYSGKDITILE